MTTAAAGAQAHPESAEGKPAAAAATVETKVEEKIVPVVEPKVAEAKAGEKVDAKVEEKPAPEAKPESKAAETKVEAKAPEKYDLKAPAKGEAYLTDAVRGRIETLARANNLSNEDAQGLVNEHVALMDATAAHYLADTQADKDYGGDHLPETQRLARSVIDRIRPEGHARRDSFNRFINSAGAGNHIDVLSFLADIGKSMAEDSPTLGRGSAGNAGSQADKLYDNPASKALHGQG